MSKTKKEDQCRLLPSHDRWQRFLQGIPSFIKKNPTDPLVLLFFLLLVFLLSFSNITDVYHHLIEHFILLFSHLILSVIITKRDILFALSLDYSTVYSSHTPFI